MDIILQFKHPTFGPTKQNPLNFCLCVNDFETEYSSESDANHLINALKTAYEITINQEGTDFCGLRLHWNYDK